MEGLAPAPEARRRQRRSSYQQAMFDDQRKPDRSILITKYSRRNLTDKKCIAAYAILSFFVISAFFYSFIMEKQKNIFRPEDPDGRKCGYGDAFSYPYIYFPVPFAGTLQYAICVKNCPKSPDDQIECLANNLISNCTFNMHDVFNRSNQFIVYPTKVNNFLSMCQPDSRILFDAVNSQINTYSLFMNFQQIYESWRVILILCPLLSILLVGIYVFIITLKKDLKGIFKAFILIFIILMFSFTIYSFTTGAKRIFMYMPILGGATGILAILFIIMLCYYRHYYERGLQLINYGAEYVRQNRGLIFMSLALFILWIFIFALQIVALIFIYSIDSTPVSMGQYKFPYFIVLQHSSAVKALICMTIAHYFWTNLILYSMGEYVCMAASNFWILDVNHNFKNSLFSLLRFHMGSIIYGSLANTFLGKITDILYIFMPNKAGGYCGCSCGNWFSRLGKCYRNNCFTNCLGIFSDLSYIRVAMKGEDLTTAGKFIANILIHDLYYVHRAYRLARIIVFISKILVAFITTLICYIYIELQPSIRGYFVTNIIIFLFSSFLCSFAFDSYDRAFEVILITILMCQHQIKFNDKKQIQVAYKPANEEEANIKEKLYRLILNWFYEEQNREKKKQQIQQKSKQSQINQSPNQRMNA